MTEQLSNETRAACAQHGLSTYCASKDGRDCHRSEIETAAQDMISDLLHLINQSGADTEAAIRMAVANFEAERDGE